VSEAKLQKKILDELKAKGYWTVKTITCNRAGVPDILACSPNGKFVAIEVKTPTGKLSVLQQVNMQQLMNLNAEVILARDIEAIDHL
jgi:Holliday junction resolvase